MKRINKQGGFTLLELLVVVAIIAIIAGAVISAISGQEERAGQGVALHTMGALENSVRQFDVLNGGLPSGLDSLVCADLTTTTNTGTLTNEEVLGASSGDADGDGVLDGGLADGLVGKVLLRDIPDFAAANVIAAGITSLRYAELDACDDDEATTNTIGTATVGDDEIAEVLANTLFWDAEAGGAGADVSLAANQVAPVVILSDPTDIGQADDTVVGVFGVGNFSEMSTSDNVNVISRGPVDGNVDGDGQYYSHFSIAIKLGETGVAATLTQAAMDDSTTAEFDEDEIEIVAILDSDGDNFDDEVAEFAGLEDE